MLVFLDTEFTDFATHDLISLALVTEDGEEFYAECVDYNQNACSEFVRKEVLPHLGAISDAACTRVELADRLNLWLCALREPATLVFDFKGDWQLLANAWIGSDQAPVPSCVGEKLLLSSHVVTHPVFEKALNAAYSDDWPPHHALADARALMMGYKAWRRFMSPFWRIK